MNSRPMVPLAAVAAAALVLALAGCGSAPLELSAPKVVEGVKVDLSAAEAQVSGYRRSRGLSPVTIDFGLVEMAQRQADAMAAAGRLSHDVDGDLLARLRVVGRPPGVAVENVSAGQMTLGAVLAGWQHSAMHNANLLDPQMRRLGIAAALAPSTRYKRFWALVMTQ